MDATMMGPGWVCVPRSAQRNPSTTPTMGFSPYTVRHGSLRRLLGYAIGVANIQNCVRKGIVNLTSLYWTLSADNQRPTPRDVTTVRMMNAGIQKIFHPGVIP